MGRGLVWRWKAAVGRQGREGGSLCSPPVLRFTCYARHISMAHSVSSNQTALLGIAEGPQALCEPREPGSSTAAPASSRGSLGSLNGSTAGSLAQPRVIHTPWGAVTVRPPDHPVPQRPAAEQQPPLLRPLHGIDSEAALARARAIGVSAAYALGRPSWHREGAPAPPVARRTARRPAPSAAPSSAAGGSTHQAPLPHEGMPSPAGQPAAAPGAHAPGTSRHCWQLQRRQRAPRRSPSPPRTMHASSAAASSSSGGGRPGGACRSSAPVPSRRWGLWRGRLRSSSCSGRRRWANFCQIRTWAHSF